MWGLVRADRDREKRTLLSSAPLHALKVFFLFSFLLESTNSDWIATTAEMYKEQKHILLTSFWLRSAAQIHQWPLPFSL